MKALRRLAVLPIRFYQRFLSPLKPPTCRFEPTCSEYGLRAILVHGVVKGTLLGAWRILRCQPFSAGGLDPVPAPGRWRSEPPDPGVEPERETEEPGERHAPEDLAPAPPSEHPAAPARRRRE